MITLQLIWRSWIAEPYKWVLSALSDSRLFERTIDVYRRQNILYVYWRLLLPVFLLDYFLAFVFYTCSVIVAQIISPISDFYSMNSFAFPLLISVEALTIGIAFSWLFSLRTGLISNLLGCTTFALSLAFTRSSLSDLTGIIAFITVIGLLLIFVMGFVLSRETNATPLVAAGFALIVAISFVFEFFFGTAGALAFGLAVALAYFSGYFRLPFYLVGTPSLVWAYVLSRRKQALIFDYLRRSALYWDEYISLPLPFLPQLLLLAYEVSPRQALAVITFVNAQRPMQRRTLGSAIVEIILRELEIHINLAQIATVAEQLAELFPAEIRLTNPHLFAPLARLDDASRDALRAISPIELSGQRKALEDFLANLAKVQTRAAFHDQRFNTRLVRIVETWNKIGQSEYDQRCKAGQEAGHLDDPYKPGQYLSLKDSLFVGRRNLAQELEGALSTGSRRPTFLLNGERRMGKTSALQQLPHLLGSSYVSVFYNLQQPGIYANTATLLGVLAEGIVQAFRARAIPIESLSYDALRSSPSDAYVYNAFESWLKGVETILEREGRTLLLAFDEFEKLEEVEFSEALNVRMLLDWMRSIIQFHQHIALLFSGVKIFSEMGTQSGLDWAGYFINVQILRISFLAPDEARRLITKPTSAYPGNDIFPPDVVEAIIVETGCHPFLVQAICSALITLLNVGERTQAVPADLVWVKEKVLEGWGGHFSNLWNRTTSELRVCLEALLALESASMAELVEKTQLDEKIVRQGLQQLLRRDLVLRDQYEAYRIAVPLFRLWMERNA